MRREYAAVFGQTQLADADLVPTSPPYPDAAPEGGDRYDDFFRQHPQIGVTVCRMSVRESVGFFNEDLLSCEDWDWSLRLAAQHQIGFVAVPCIRFRQRPIGTHDDLQWERLAIDTRAVIDQYRRSGRRRPAPWSAARVLLRSRGHFSWYFVQSSLVHSKRGEREAQGRSLYRAFRASPIHATVNLAKSAEFRHAIAAFFHGFGV